MPRGDGTGPMGQGRGMGRGMGGGMGRGRGGLNRNNFSLGSGGNCIGPNCGEKIVHQIANPCITLKCPKCGTSMTREL